MRVLLLSSTLFGLECLKKGIRPVRSVRLAGIVTTARRIKISYSAKKVDICSHADFRQIAKSTGCLLWFVKNDNCHSLLETAVRKSKPDLILALGWYYKIPQSIRGEAEAGVLGIHASLLPKYRGGAPLVWAMIQGEKRTGVTLFHLEERMDTGDVVAQRSFPITCEDTIASVCKKAVDVSAGILRRYLPLLAKGKAPRKIQDESQATVFPQRSPKDGLIDWSWDAGRVRDFIRAQTRPYPGAFTFLKRKKITIWDCNIERTKMPRVRK